MKEIALIFMLLYAPSTYTGSGGQLTGIKLTQLKPHERGNCFQWKGCRGDSIGAMWIYDLISCGRLGGKSWLDEQGKCHDVPPGARS